MKPALFIFICIACVSKLGGADGALEPLSAFTRGEEYFRATRDALVGPSEYCWMIVLPSFSPEYAVLLKSRPAESASKRFQLFFEVVRAQKPIFGWEDLGGGRSRACYDRMAGVTRVAKDIGQQDADLLAEVSFAAFQRMRVPKAPRIGLDGTTYLFCFDRYSGKAWSPDAGDAAALVDAWTAAREYVEKSGEAAKKALLKFRASCARIKKGHNKALEPTSTAVTPRAEQEPPQPTPRP